MMAIRGVYSTDAPGWRTAAHTRARGKALKPNGWVGCRDGRYTTALEEQLTRTLRKLSARYATAQRRHSGQVEASRGHVERQGGENEALRTPIEWLDGQLERLAECYGTLGATLW